MFGPFDQKWINTGEVTRWRCPACGFHTDSKMRPDRCGTCGWFPGRSNEPTVFTATKNDDTITRFG